MTKSKLYQRDRVRNRDAYRTSTKIYNRVWVENKQGEWQACLFTDSQIKSGIDRAVKNPEDVYPMVLAKEKYSLWQRIKFLFNKEVFV